MRLLVVEDHKRLAAALKRGLDSEGFATDIALNGTDGLWLATENAYDAIVLDIMLPGINGYQICSQLRETGDWTPILMLTAKDGEYDEAEALPTTRIDGGRDSLQRTGAVAARCPINLVGPRVTRAFNEFWFRQSPRHHVEDGLARWNRLYGPGGLQQWQCAVPVDACHVIPRALEPLGAAHLGSPMVILKRFDPNCLAPLSFPIPRMGALHRPTYVSKARRMACSCEILDPGHLMRSDLDRRLDLRRHGSQGRQHPTIGPTMRNRYY